VAAGIALAGLTAILAPAIAVQWGLLNAGVGSVDDDILMASAIVGATHMVLAWRRLRDEERTALRRVHIWIASLNALVVLALGASLLLLFVLYWFPDEHASLANRGFPAFVLWGGIQAVAVLLAEATGRFLFQWLELHEPVATPARLQGRPARRPSRVVAGEEADGPGAGIDGP
jgi:hypothetical protein